MIFIYVILSVIYLGLSAAHDLPPLPSVVLPTNSLLLPINRQATATYCGVASLQTVMNYWQVYDGRQDVLAELLGTTDDGTKPENIVSVAQSFNLTASMKNGSALNDLREALSSGVTVILDLQAWTDQENVNWQEDWEDGHYVVLIGMNEKLIFIMDPSTAATYAYLPISEFLDRWHDYETGPEGEMIKYINLAIFINGSTPLPHPAPLLYMA